MSTKTERTEQIAKLTEDFKAASAVLVTKYEGTTVAEITDVRGKLRDADAKYVVVKNTLAKKAMAECGIEGLDDYFKGPVGVVFAMSENASAPAKVINNYNKDNDEKLELKAAYFDGTVFAGDDAKKIADLPTREDLYSMFLSCLNAPVTKLAGTLDGILTNFVRTVEAVRVQKETE